MTELMEMIVMNLVTPKVGALHELWFNKLASAPTRGWYVEQMLMLSSSFRCDKIFKYERYLFGSLFVVLLSLT